MATATKKSSATRSHRVRPTATQVVNASSLIKGDMLIDMDAPRNTPKEDRERSIRGITRFYGGSTGKPGRVYVTVVNEDVTGHEIYEYTDRQRVTIRKRT